MNQPKLNDPQFECGAYEIWISGIIDTLMYRVSSSHTEPPYSLDVYLTLEEKLTKCQDNLDLANLRQLKPDLYETLLSNVGYLLRKVCSEIPDPCDKLTFQSRFIEIIFLNVLRENGILTEPTKYYYESVLDIFSRTTFGLAFFIDLMADHGWYKHGSKFLDRFEDVYQINLILAKLTELSCDFHLNVLIVIWNIEASLEKPDDNALLRRFLEFSKLLLEQSKIKTFNFKNNLAVYLSIINSTLEEFLGLAAKQAARELNLHVPLNPNDCEKVDLVQANVSFSSLSYISNFINELGKSLFPGQEYKDFERLQDCFQDSKSVTIIEMVASISEIYEFLGMLAMEFQNLPLSELQFEGYDAVKIGWDRWKNKADTIDLTFWEILSLKRYFAPGREESRFLTIATLKHGLPKYFDVLEAVESETYLDPFVLHSLCCAMDDVKDSDFMDDLILILRRVLRSIKSRKRISAFLKARVKFHGLYPYGETEKSKLPLLLKHGKSGSIMYDQVREDIILCMYISPYDFLEQIVADALEHRHTMLPFLVKLFCVELAPVCSSEVDSRFCNTYLETLLNGRLSTVPSDATVQGLLLLIKEIYSFYYHAKNPITPKVMGLEKLMLHFAWDGCCDPEKSVEAKISMFKLIQGLSDTFDQPWSLVKQAPQFLLYNLTQFIDYFWYDGSKKIYFIELIEYIMNKKVERKLSDSEVKWMERRITHNGEETALLAYLDTWTERSLENYINLENKSRAEVLMLAASLKNNHWVRAKNKLDMKCNHPAFRSHLSPVLRVLCRSEYDNLFYFLCYYNAIDDVFLGMTESFTHQAKLGEDVNMNYITNCMLDCLKFHLDNYFKEPILYKPGKFCLRIENRKALLPVVYRWTGIMLFHSELVNENYRRVREFMVEIAKEMFDLGVDAESCYFKNNAKIHDIAKHILFKFYGPMYYTRPKTEIRLIPG